MISLLVSQDQVVEGLQGTFNMTVDFIYVFISEKELKEEIVTLCVLNVKK